MSRGTHQKLTQSEKRKTAGAVVLLAVIAVTLFADFSSGIIRLLYIVGIIALVAIFEIYFYFMYLSDRFRSFSHPILYIYGTAGKNRTYIDADGKFVYRISGECNGAALRLPSGIHIITFRSGSVSSAVRADIADNLIIRIGIRDSAIEINTEHKKQAETEKEIESGRMDSKRLDVAVFITVNLSLFLAALRVLALLGIIG